MKKAENMDDGLGLPEWRLALLLLLSWSIMCLIMIKGVASSGKAAYFTAIFPYCVLITLLIRGATLPGATDGMYYFIKPDWDKILDIRVEFSQPFCPLNNSWRNSYTFNTLFQRRLAFSSRSIAEVSVIFPLNTVTYSKVTFFAWIKNFHQKYFFNQKYGLWSFFIPLTPPT